LLWRRIIILKQILYSIYSGEYPYESTGGPNNIIHKLIKYTPLNRYQFDYLSSDLFAKDLTSQNLDEIHNRLSIRKKTAASLYEKSIMYRKFFSSNFYLPFHFIKKDMYYKSFRKKIDQYDILHCHDSVSLSLIANRESKAKKIMTIHSKGLLSDELMGMYRSKRLQNIFEKKIKKYELENVKLADIVTFPSKAAKKYYENSLNVSLNNVKTKIIYNGIDFEKFIKVEKDEILEKYAIEKKNNNLLLNVASHALEKNIDILLKVVSKLKRNFKQNIKLINVGPESKITKNLKNSVRDLGIENNVIFLGKIPNDDVIRLIKATDLFIMTSKKVIFDLVVLEALACGACCVVSNDGGNKEIIKDGENGYLIDTNDVDTIAKKIVSIIPHKNKVKENAIRTAKQFSVHKMANEYFELYESLFDEM
jgi:glycosyltransferase involved in cell wall biosynthesis